VENHSRFSHKMFPEYFKRLELLGNHRVDFIESTEQITCSSDISHLLSCLTEFSLESLFSALSKATSVRGHVIFCCDTSGNVQNVLLTYETEKCRYDGYHGYDISEEPQKL